MLPARHVTLALRLSRIGFTLLLLSCGGTISGAASPGHSPSSGGDGSDSPGCDTQSAQACLDAAIVAQERGDTAAMLRALHRACDADHARACGLLGDQVHVPGSDDQPSDGAPPYAHWQRACELGYAPSCFNLGVAYERGEGVASDLDRAIELYTTACNGEAAGGCINLASVAMRGDGPNALDFAFAFHHFERACLMDHPHGCTLAASCHVEGIGTPVNRDLGAGVLRFHCDADFELACELLDRYSLQREPEDGQPTPAG